MFKESPTFWLDHIQDLFDYLEVYTPNWSKVKKQKTKRANTGRGEKWTGEAIPAANENVKSATAEFSMFVGAWWGIIV